MANPYFEKLRENITAKRVRVFILLLVLALSAFILYLDITIRTQFEGKRWALPARVYARPLELYPGMKLTPAQLTTELAVLGYRNTVDPRNPGSFRWHRKLIEVITQPFVFSDGAQASLLLRLRFSGNRLDSLTDLGNDAPIILARLDPLLIGSIYPTHKEDRILVQLDEMPQDLINALIAMEDHRFYTHHGIDPRGIARAVVTTVSGDEVQGGSTLTQQLIKNFYLSSKRTLTRKFTEMLMALLLEWHYDKDEILQAYANEIYLGQEGKRAIHGFGLASQFYFAEPLDRLQLPQSALLVALLKGPSFYDPRRHPKRALERRNLVLSEMARQEFITREQYDRAIQGPLGVTHKPPSGVSPYPAFLDLVQRQLRRDYRDEDLRSEGLRIFTTLDPLVQRTAEHALTSRLTQLEKSKRLPQKSLEAATVVTDIQNGEIQALVGGRDPRFAGFNRPLDAMRPIGSLIKPVVFLTALEQPDSYTLMTPLDDTELVWREYGSDDWVPKNYDNEFHGNVPLHVALVKSYNISTARLGLNLGVSHVMANVRRLGVDRVLSGYASSLLGSNALTPMEVVQMYQTLASGGYRVPLRAIREVLTTEGEPLQRYPLAVEQVLDPAPVYLLTTALQGVVREGTAQGLNHYLPPEINIAGKTGTTDDLRDSWFAGFTGERLAVVWVGRDDNQPSRLTGASGAMTIWGAMMTKLDPEPLIPPQPENVEWVWVDAEKQLRADQGCAGAVELPFIHGSAPTDFAPCASGSGGGAIKSWFERIFD